MQPHIYLVIFICLTLNQNTVTSYEWCPWKSETQSSNKEETVQTKLRTCNCGDETSLSCTAFLTETVCRHPTTGIQIACSNDYENSLKPKLKPAPSDVRSIRFKKAPSFSYRAYRSYYGYGGYYYGYTVRTYYCYSLACNTGYLSGLIVGVLLFIAIAFTVSILLCCRYKRLQRMRINGGGVIVTNGYPHETTTVTTVVQQAPPPPYNQMHYGNNGYYGNNQHQHETSFNNNSGHYNNAFAANAASPMQPGYYGAPPPAYSQQYPPNHQHQASAFPPTNDSSYPPSLPYPSQ